MIKLPKAYSSKQKAKRYILKLGGINRTDAFGEGELETSEGISSSRYPAVAVRKGREKLTAWSTAEDVIYADGILSLTSPHTKTDADTGEAAEYCYITYRSETEGATLQAYKEIPKISERREAAAVGGTLVLFPDKLCLDLTSSYPTWKEMEATVSYSQEKAVISNNKVVFNTSADFLSFKNAFKAGDVVEFLGGYYKDNKTVRCDGSKIIRSISSSERTVTFDPYAFGEADNSDNAQMSFSKTVPSLKHLCTSGGRLWGVGADSEGKNKIYASKYSDPTNFEYFDLSSADSYTLETSTPGGFTGSAALDNGVLFFKENQIMRITGTKPSNFRLITLDTVGVMQGSERSIAVIDDIVYYEGKDGIYATDGSRAKKISEALGEFKHSSGVGGADKKIYVISTLADDEYTLYCYDTEKDMWLRDSALQMKNAFRYLGALYYLGGDGYMYKFSDEAAEDISYFIQLREISENFLEQKGFSKLYLCYSMKEGGKIKIEAKYGSGTSAAFETVARITDFRRSAAEIKLKPNRADFVKLKITATSDVVIKSLMREHYAHGSLF